ncbi:hypothetical protein SAMN05444411_104158 [Lutibacter oricola]|uniref:Uncharacterized protein n=1 Tax=Lutibacter oricola TaxID=762486 RepID=A0A1H3AKW1_9FLAO|nr:hypothetical protein SAMN05444411_104158 [Lutibacter oricola]
MHIQMMDISVKMMNYIRKNKFKKKNTIRLSIKFQFINTTKNGLQK